MAQPAPHLSSRDEEPSSSAPVGAQPSVPVNGEDTTVPERVKVCPVVIDLTLDDDDDTLTAISSESSPTTTSPSSSSPQTIPGPPPRPQHPRRVQVYSPSTVPGWLRDGNKRSGSRQANTWGAHTLVVTAFVCKERGCAKGFKTEESLKEHGRVAHWFEKKIGCPFVLRGCGKKFLTERGKELHHETLSHDLRAFSASPAKCPFGEVSLHIYFIDACFFLRIFSFLRIRTQQVCHLRSPGRLFDILMLGGVERVKPDHLPFRRSSKLDVLGARFVVVMLMISNRRQAAACNLCGCGPSTEQLRAGVLPFFFLAPLLSVITPYLSKLEGATRAECQSDQNAADLPKDG
ncbi:hypothetical protein DFP72DRAFT_1043219 [Ephemerocybe angulata]|uniref:C2H2-type domain-containing protein n=1 Tax=Ephemerocybe angulata TaxID=980116 RepID=A0A8H6I878_9AGAR|nr:hypothetical protein DFP72DRAFT_1043219 [Tulosesus angulatus]